jgi:ribosome-binding protein aMBF1 (putative translation factor)
MKVKCDWCGKSVSKVGKLVKVKFLMLCKKCREKFKKKEKRY